MKKNELEHLKNRIIALSLKEIADYPLSSKINKITDTAYQINDKLLLIKPLIESSQLVDEYVDHSNEKESDGIKTISFHYEDFRPFGLGLGNDWYVYVADEGVGGTYGFLLTPKNLKHLLYFPDVSGCYLHSGHSVQDIQIEPLKNEGYFRRFKLSNLQLETKPSLILNASNFPNCFPRDFMGNVKLDDVVSMSDFKSI